jgi:hypothetical protein
MTATYDGAPRIASDKTQCYEWLRARVLEARHAPLAAQSAVVLVRQGMSAWMQLDDDSRDAEPDTRSDLAQHQVCLSAPEHSELLAVLTGLVFSLCNHKESA